MSKGAITLTIVFEGMNLNRDEGVGGNIQTLKKLHRDDIRFIYVSDKAIRYSIREVLIYKFNWTREIPLVTDEVIQYDLANANIITQPELDLFGYMYTTDIFTLTRCGPVGVTPAIALEPYRDDISFNANQGLVNRARLQGKLANPDIRYQEDNLSLFKYSITLDLDEVGKDIWFIPLKKEDKKVSFEINKKKFNSGLKIQKGEKITLSFTLKNSTVELNLPPAEEDTQATHDNKLMVKTNKGRITIFKRNDSYVQILFEVDQNEIAKRIEEFIKALAWLHRKVSGNPSDLKPLLVVGGWIKVKGPICHNLIHLSNHQIEINGLKKAINYVKKVSIEDNFIIASFESDHPYFQSCKNDSNINENWEKAPPVDLEKFAEKIKDKLSPSDNQSKT